MVYILPKLKDDIRAAAQSRCEYCLLHKVYTEKALEFDHIIATQHGGLTVLENLCLACFDCNRQKGPNLCSVDPDSGDVVRLFDPRQQLWAEHFRVRGAVIEPLTAVARATVRVLDVNSVDRLVDRQPLAESALYP